MLSIVVPVRNDAPSVSVMVRILDAIVEVPNEVIVVYDDLGDTCVPVIEQLRKRYSGLRGVHNDIARGVLVSGLWKMTKATRARVAKHQLSLDYLAVSEFRSCRYFGTQPNAKNIAY